jgi:hypothetical protein
VYTALLHLLLLQGQLPEIRALMLERLGRHRDALAVYVSDLRRLTLAADRGEAGASAGASAGTSSGMDGSGRGELAQGGGLGSSAVLLPPRSAGRWGQPRVVGHPAGVTALPAAAVAMAALPAAASPQLLAAGSTRQQHRRSDGSGSGAAAAPAAAAVPPPPGSGWMLLPFGSRPQDIYMELVDAVMTANRKVC